MRQAFLVYLKAFVLMLPFTVALVYFSRGWLWLSSEQAGDLAEFAAAVFPVPLALYMRRTRGFLLYLALTLVVTGSRYAESWEKLHTTLHDATYSTCANDPPEDVESGEWTQFCACYTDAMLKEFSARELAAFGRSMKIGTPDPSIKTRVQPLVERCAAQGKTP